jgi:L-ribulose-5-phosphate 3-epimerase
VKIGLNSWTLGGWRLSLPGGYEEALRVAAALGYQGLELVYDDAAHSPEKIDKQARKRIKEAASSNGLELPSVATAVFWRYSLASPQDAERRRALEYVRSGLEISADLDADTLLVVPAVANPEVGYRETYSRAQDSLKQAAKWAENLGVNIGVENVWNRFLYDPLIFRRFVEEIGSERVGVYFDVGNVLELSPFEHWLEILGDKILVIHAKDYDMTARGPAGFRYVGQGSVDWTKFIASLRSINYRGFLNVETPPDFTKPPYSIRIPEDGVDAARASLEGLKKYLA